MAGKKGNKESSRTTLFLRSRTTVLDQEKQQAGGCKEWASRRVPKVETRSGKPGFPR
jgi:hypothetical protein